MSRIRKTFAGLIAAAAVLSVSACGTSTDDIEDKLKSAYEKAGLEDDKAENLAECMAPKLKDGLSDDGIDTLMDADTDDIAKGEGGKFSMADAKVAREATKKCAEEENVQIGG